MLYYKYSLIRKDVRGTQSGRAPDAGSPGPLSVESGHSTAPVRGRVHQSGSALRFSVLSLCVRSHPLGVREETPGHVTELHALLFSSLEVRIVPSRSAVFL